MLDTIITNGMGNKLQELTDKLYNEGLSKGKEEGEAILAKANEQASNIVESAKKQAEEIIAKAQKEAEDFKSNVQSDVEMAASKSIQTTKHHIENLIVTKIVDKPVTDALSSPEFIKEILKEVAQKFSAQDSSDLNLVLPEAMQAKLEPFVNGELSKLLGKGINASFSKRFNGGFTIGPKNGSYFISFTDETFKSLIGEYLRPTTKKLLFGE